MTLRFALLLAALAATAAPAPAQDQPYDPGPPPPLPAWEDEWEENPDDEYVEDEPLDNEDGHVAHRVMGVDVPVVAEQPDCECETVVEESVEERPAPPRTRRLAPRRDKRIRITK